MKSIKIDLKDWVIVIGRHLGDYIQNIGLLLLVDI